jgi:hypothetical protein
MPDSLKQRLVRYHLVDNTRGEPPMWQEAEIRHLEMTLQGGRIVGEVHLQTITGDRGYVARMLGLVEARNGKIVRFDLVSKGDFWGEGQFTGNAPKGRFGFAVSFRVNTGSSAADRVIPGGARGSVERYLK